MNRQSIRTETTRAPEHAAAWTDRELDTLTNHRLDEAINAGHPPEHLDAWKRAARARELANEAARPGWIRRCAAGITAHHAGKRITGYRWERVMHSGSYIRDPYGTDELPKGYQA